MKAVFIDTMGWFSLLNQRDAFHEQAVAQMNRLRRIRSPLITTDYVVDETATLLKVRGAGVAIDRYFEALKVSKSVTLTFIGPDRFQEAVSYFQRYRDHGYSFTDVSSFVVMRELGLRRVFTHDRHFREAGFELLL